MPHIYLPASSADDWQQFLADPDKQWRSGYSARATAHSWQEADGFPAEIEALLATASKPELRDAELLMAIPEHKVYFPPMQGHPSQNDVFGLAKASDGRLVSIMVEAKVSEPFDKTVAEWMAKPSSGKEQRLEFLRDSLHLGDQKIDHVRYQLLHRLSSALIEAERFGAKYAVLIIHSFSQSDEWFEDFTAFISLYGQSAEVGQLVTLDVGDDPMVFAGWAKGHPKYLDA